LYRVGDEMETRKECWIKFLHTRGQGSRTFARLWSR